MKRTIIERSKDGNILVTRQASRELSGGARERRRERRARLFAEALPEWKRVGRRIVRNDILLPDYIDAWEPTQVRGEQEANAYQNDVTALEYRKLAHDIVADIDRRAAAFDAEQVAKDFERPKTDSEKLAIAKRVLLQHINGEDYEMSLSGLFAELSADDFPEAA